MKAPLVPMLLAAVLTTSCSAPKEATSTLAGDTYAAVELQLPADLAKALFDELMKYPSSKCVSFGAITSSGTSCQGLEISCDAFDNVPWLYTLDGQNHHVDAALKPICTYLRDQGVEIETASGFEVRHLRTISAGVSISMPIGGTATTTYSAKGTATISDLPPGETSLELGEAWAEVMLEVMKEHNPNCLSYGAITTSATSCQGGDLYCNVASGDVWLMLAGKDPINVTAELTTLCPTLESHFVIKEYYGGQAFWPMRNLQVGGKYYTPIDGTPPSKTLWANGTIWVAR